MANQVTLTFAGDDKDIKRSFDDVGKSSEVMAVRVSDATNEAAEKFDHLSSQSSLLSGGIGDVGGALTEAFGEDNPIGAFGAQMEKASAIIMGFTGLMDLAVFATNNFKVATLAKAAADRIASAAQWLMNTALLASPVTWIVLAIVALIAVIVLIATKTDWFSRAWRASWDWIKKAASNTWDFLKKIPGWIGTAFSKVANFITAPYKAAFNAIARLWNSTIGQLSWTVPNWIPFIGGKSISVPQLPTFHAGGIVPGVVGTAVPIMAQAGEEVSGIASAGRGDEEWIRLDLGRLGAFLLDEVSKAVAGRGGRVTDLGVKVVNGAIRT
jgi:ABC-type multidrug transport system fused ATPase/permease subunit